MGSAKSSDSLDSSKNGLSLGVFFIVADPVFYCRKPPKTLSLAPLKTVAERVFSTFSSILLIKLWYVPQFELEVKITHLVHPPKRAFWAGAFGNMIIFGRVDLGLAVLTFSTSRTGHSLLRRGWFRRSPWSEART
ncbi:MAG: hypothetical protein WBO68_13600, partial [Pyrinomonadaceae bacterium]